MLTTETKRFDSRVTTSTRGRMFSGYAGVPRNDHADLNMDSLQLKTLPNINQSKSPADDPEVENGGKTVGATIRTFALDETTAHGFPSIFRSKTSLGRLLWTTLFLAGLVGTIYQGTLLVIKFNGYPVNVEVKIVSKPRLPFPSVTVCNTNKLRMSKIDMSKYRQMLVVDQTTSLPYYAPCLPQDFKCRERPVCIKTYLQCDAIRQCGGNDTSDEEGCDYESRTCPNGQFRCFHSGSSLGLCIPGKMKCDRRKDCYEGEDEDGCTCKGSEFKCKIRGGCISKGSVCDGVPHCFDGSDEERDMCGTGGTCDPSSSFRCQSGNQCIKKVFRCDSYNDCHDGSDEQECFTVGALPTASELPQALICNPEWFPCTSGSTTCIESGWVCDQSLDCSDGSDETLELCGRPHCTPPKVACESGGGCATPCDLKAECVNGTDERNCSCDIVTSDTPNEVLQEVICRGVSSSDFSRGSLTNERFVARCGTRNRRKTETPYYHCEGLLECYDPTTSLPEPCTTVYSECFVSSNGQDYRGMVMSTIGLCLPWAASFNFTGQIYPELEGWEPGSTVDHAYCRNPGGEREAPGCNAPTFDGLVRFEVCQDLPSSPTCHTSTFDVVLSSDDGDGDPSRGRVVVNYGPDASGTINDPDWTLDDADVVCRQLGYRAGALKATNAGNGDLQPGTGRVLLKNMRCSGDEANLVDCLYVVVTDQDWDHSHDVGVVCNDSVLDTRRQRRDADDRRRDINDEPCPECSLNSKTTKASTTTTTPCGDRSFQCFSDGECIPYWQTCNKFPDCKDGSDEWKADCDDKPSECGPDQFQCNETNRVGKRKCINVRFVCDGYNDCGPLYQAVTEGMERDSDELRCPEPGESPPENYFKCQGENRFTHEYNLCNTKKDCLLSLHDEENCMTSDLGDVYRKTFEDPYWFVPYTGMVAKKKQSSLFNNFTSAFRVPPFGRVKGDDPPDWNRFVTFSATPDYSDLVDVAKIPRDEVRELGHQLEDFILQCTYEQRQCNMSAFEEFQDDKYGNCYTFNDKDSQIFSSMTGASYGLQMTLFLEQSEYISIYGQEAGVRVSIDPPHIQPNPTDSGITITPGSVTSLGLRYNHVVRKGLPYGQCQKLVKNTKAISNGVIRNMTANEQYDREFCKKTCVHGHILKYCGCSDTMELDGPRCKLLNRTQEICRQLVYYMNQQNKLSCNKDCPQQCTDVYYTKTSSMSTWPSNKFAKHLLRNIHSINEKTRQLNEDNVFDNVVRLEVFYEEFNYESTKEIPAYQASSLFGDIGGTVGLYIGFSLITVCEFIALGFRLIKRFCLKAPTPVHV